MNFLLALGVLCGFATKLTTVSGLNSTAIPPTTMNVTSSGCRGQLKAYNNVVESPGYPFRYPNYMDCYFWVPISQGKALRIVFDDFNLESHSSCGWDYLRIRNDKGFTYGKYCGVQSGKIVLVTGSRASFHFHSDFSIQRQGFRLYLSTISSDCSPIVNNTWESPGYPSSYPRNLDCNISVPIPSGAEMRIFFQAFYLPYSSYGGCWYDYLVIRNDNGDDFGTYCGSRAWTTVVVNGTNVVLTFHSGSRRNGGRFRLRFTPIYPTAAPSTQPPAPTTYPACPQLINNTLESPGYPSYYTHRMDCNISVPIPSGTDMRIFFENFYTPRFYWNCGDYGSLELMNENGDSFGKYCGNKTGQAVVVNGSLVVLRYRSGDYGSYGRFRLLFTPVYPFPTNHPNPSQVPPSHGRDPQSQLRKFIANLRDILVQMEYVVDNQLGGPSFGNFTKREHIARINDAVKNVEAAMKRAGPQKRKLDTVTFEQLKKRAAEVIAKMENKEDQFKKRAQLDVAKGKSQVEDQKLAKEREENIQKNLFKEEKIGR
ncbi:CUB domain-containing protein 2-like [Acropora muricata]|uniref:CUB domain-containing protein 2-like n=1 Tax=Acropora muricata TaxID=159855 RepID=UPI0034E56F27